MLRILGYDIVSIGGDNPSTTDQSVMEIAQREQRLIVTFDRDYGELIYRQRYTPERGVLYLRLHQYLPEDSAKIVHELLNVFKIETTRRLTVYDGKTIRQRRY